MCLCIYVYVCVYIDGCWYFALKKWLPVNQTFLTTVNDWSISNETEFSSSWATELDKNTKNSFHWIGSLNTKHFKMRVEIFSLADYFFVKLNEEKKGIKNGKRFTVLKYFTIISYPASVLFSPLSG